MIVSASYRTDIPALYGAWFLNRLRAEYARVHNPYGGPAALVPLTPASVDAFVFWTRNLGPFAPALEEVARRGFPFVVQYTITGYPRALEPTTIAPAAAVAQIRAVVARYGASRVVWRYDPIVCTTLTPVDWHLAAFAELAQMLEGVVDEVVVSWCQVYRKTQRNLDAAACAKGFGWYDPDAGEKTDLLCRLAAIARRQGMALTLCGQPGLLAPGVGEARCIDAERLSRIAGRPLVVRHHAHREHCGCWATRDIGVYDSCTQGCAYCYAVNSRPVARRRRAAHDPEAEFLIPATRHPAQKVSSTRPPAGSGGRS